MPGPGMSPAQPEALGPREVFARMRRGWITGETLEHALLADDAVIEVPFAAPGRPQRFTGRDEFLAVAGPARAALPVRFEACRELAVHETVDPEVIVVEYELTGTLTSTGRSASASFIGVLRVRDGRIALWREYQNTLAILTELGRLPEG